ncbi:hypothetical protein Angca_007738, partial [Angiostrongylus cantonensis]
FRLVFNSTTGLSSNMPGVDIRVPGFGGTNTIEWLDKSKASPGLYFFTLVEQMVSWGYSRGKNLLGAPFDWRKSPNELHLYFDLLKTTIETTYRYNGHTKVITLGHSMGNPIILYFFNHIVDQVTVHEILGAEHMAILHNPVATEIVRKAIFGLL